jgi:hypothetical protein
VGHENCVRNLFGLLGKILECKRFSPCTTSSPEAHRRGQTGESRKLKPYPDGYIPLLSSRRRRRGRRSSCSSRIAPRSGDPTRALNHCERHLSLPLASSAALRTRVRLLPVDLSGAHRSRSAAPPVLLWTARFLFVRCVLRRGLFHPRADQMLDGFV